MKDIEPARKFNTIKHQSWWKRNNYLELMSYNKKINTKSDTKCKISPICFQNITWIHHLTSLENITTCKTKYNTLLRCYRKHWTTNRKTCDQVTRRHHLSWSLFVFPWQLGTTYPTCAQCILLAEESSARENLMFIYQVICIRKVKNNP